MVRKKGGWSSGKRNITLIYEITFCRTKIKLKKPALLIYCLNANVRVALSSTHNLTSASKQKPKNINISVLSAFTLRMQVQCAVYLLGNWLDLFVPLSQTTNENTNYPAPNNCYVLSTSIHTIPGIAKTILIIVNKSYNTV